MVPQSILVIKLRYLGDVLLATPTLRALRVAYPTASVTALVNRGTDEMLVANPDVDDVIPLDRGSIHEQWRFAMSIRRRKFDMVVDLTDGDRAAILTWFSGASVRIGFNAEHRWTGQCFTTVVSGEPWMHRIERDLAALTPLKIVPTDGIPRLYLTHEDETRAEELLAALDLQADRSIVVIQPGARYWFKAWPAERFAEVADRLADQFGCQVLVGGSQQEQELAQSVVREAKSRVISIAGLTTIRTLAGLLKQAALFVGNDSGVMHMATAIGTPVVGMFGPSNPAEWGPRGGPAEVIYKGIDCRTCFHPTCRRGEQNCMKLITVDEVFAAAGRLLAIKNRVGGLHHGSCEL